MVVLFHCAKSLPVFLFTLHRRSRSQRLPYNTAFACLFGFGSTYSGDTPRRRKLTISLDSSNFTQSLFSCVSGNCTSELSSAENLAQEFCDLQSPSVSLSFPSASTNSSGTSTSTSSITSATSAAFSLQTNMKRGIFSSFFLDFALLSCLFILVFFVY